MGELTLSLAFAEVAEEVDRHTRLRGQVCSHLDGEELVDGVLGLELRAEALDGDRGLLLLISLAWGHGSHLGVDH